MMAFARENVPEALPAPAVGDAASSSPSGSLAPEPRVRVLFPETWLWNDTNTE